MKTIIMVSLFLIAEGDTTKIDSTKAKVDSVNYISKQQAAFFSLYAEQKTQIDSIKKQLNDPAVIKKLRKKLKK